MRRYADVLLLVFWGTEIDNMGFIGLRADLGIG